MYHNKEGTHPPSPKQTFQKEAKSGKGLITEVLSKYKSLYT